MGKKVVVLTGSPRKNGNSFAMTDAFIDAAKAEGHEVTRFDTASMTIAGCRACESCYSIAGQACVFDDDYNVLAPVVEAAEVVVFTMPVYWYTMPAQIKSAIDRMFSFMVGQRDIEGKECLLISCCEEDDISVLDGVKMPYERTIALLKWKSLGEVLVTGVLNAGDINKTDGCEKAAALAKLL